MSGKFFAIATTHRTDTAIAHILRQVCKIVVHFIIEDKMTRYCIGILWLFIFKSIFHVLRYKNLIWFDYILFHHHIGEIEKMDIYIQKLEEFLKSKTEVVKEHNRVEEEERVKSKDTLKEDAMSYDMNKFLKSVREFEADRAKKSKKKKESY
jgi:hypothetical protein